METEVKAMTNSVQDSELRERAIERLKKKRDFWSHVFAWALVNAFLVGIWAVTGGNFFWPIFPILGWGVGVFFHGWDVYARPPTEERINEEMRRLGAN
jgi:polyferredoxin